MSLVLAPVVLGPHGEATTRVLVSAAGIGDGPGAQGLARLAMVGVHAELVADMVLLAAAVSLTVRLAWPSTRWVGRQSWQVLVGRHPGIPGTLSRIGRAVGRAGGMAWMAAVGLAVAVTVWRIAPSLGRVALDPTWWPFLATVAAMIGWGVALRRRDRRRATAASSGMEAQDGSL